MNAGKLVVLALLVMVVALALVVPISGVAQVDVDGGIAAQCQSGFACGGVSVAEYPPPGQNAKCQSGFACGG